MVYAACSRRRKSLIQKDLRVEPVVGFELTTDGLQNRCSTTELNWLIWTREWESNPRISFCRAAPYHLAIPRLLIPRSDVILILVHHLDGLGPCFVSYHTHFFMRVLRDDVAHRHAETIMTLKLALVHLKHQKDYTPKRLTCQPFSNNKTKKSS